MRDISRKFESLRSARARSVLRLAPATLELVRRGEVPKGDPLPVARVAAIQAAKDTARLIPYCHPVAVDYVGVEFTLLDEGRIETTVEVKALHRTGVEMEALTGAAVAALTLYDMLKMLDRTMELEGVRLLEKRGGKSDFPRLPQGAAPAAGVLVASDRVSRGEAEDRSGKLLAERLEQAGYRLAVYRVVPDERERIEAALMEFADRLGLELVLTTGGTGLGPRDVTPEATRAVLERQAEGLIEGARAYGLARTPLAMLSRGAAGYRGRTLIINLPGSPRGVEESLEALLAPIAHALRMMRGEGHEGGDQVGQP